MKSKSAKSSYELNMYHYYEDLTMYDEFVDQGLETCNLKNRQSSASRGVRSQTQLPMADLFAPVKVETIPLLSPTMELEMMREPWSFPREPANYAIVNPITNQPQQQQQQQQKPSQLTQQQQSNVNATSLSAWEENFQDLSGWCMAGIQVRCDFPAGESVMTSKLTGTRIEGSSDVLTAANGVTRNLMKPNNNHSNNLGGTGNGVDVSPQHDHAYTSNDHQHQQQQQQMYFNSAINPNGKSRATNTWMTKDDKNIKPETNASNNVWQELTDLGIIAIPSDNATTATITTAPMYQSQATFDELETKPDVFQSIETDAPNNFDLLSYLIDEDIPSPNDSISTDSSRVTDININTVPSSNVSAHVVVSPRTYEPIAITASNTSNDVLKARLQAADSPLPQIESPKHSPLSSTSSEVTVPTRHSYRQLRSIIKVEKPDSPPEPVERRSTRPRRSRTISSTSSFSGSSRGRKRTFDESDDDDDEDEGYREVREKNNEASRKSRMNKKAKEMEMARRAVELEKDNRILKMKVEELEKLVNSMRNALLRSALKREVKTTNMF